MTRQEFLNDCKIEIINRGVGGQQVGDTNQQFKLTHNPTGIEIFIPCPDRSQHRTLESAKDALELLLLGLGVI